MFAIVDLETTGGSPNKDRITEIAVLVHNGKRVIEEFTSFVNPQRPIDPFVVALTGISDDMVAGAPTFKELADKITKLTQGNIFVAHNVRFDYGILKHEFKRLGQHFNRKQLCTIRLARKIFPGLPSYSLGKLCRSLEIPLENRHRAYGDAEATTLLFEKLLFNDRKELIDEELRQGLEDNMLPPHIKREELEGIPEECGVYYFTDQLDRIIYIGKSKNIKKRVYSHFINDLNSQRFRELKEEVHHIRYELTGNELIAMLHESAEIKRFMPKHNKAQRKTKYRFGIFMREDNEGFKYLAIDSLKLEEEPVIKCSYRRIAESLLERIIHDNKLMPQIAIRSRVKQDNGIEAFRDVHNDNIHKAVSRYFFPHRNFFIIGNAVNPDENSAIWVENNKYKGFGFYNPDFIGNSPDSLKEVVRHKEDNPDVQRIIRSWLRKNKKTKLITY